jgi:hypothetical protein
VIGDSLHERRLVIYLVSEEHLQDKACFDPIYADLKSGGYEEFLHYLLHIELGDRHPRQQLKTAELAQYQRMSGDSITQWARACVEADLLRGQGSCGISLGQRIQSEDLRQSHAWYCKQQSLRPANEVVFGGGMHDDVRPTPKSRASRPVRCAIRMLNRAPLPR